MKKAHEISMLCDAKVALIVFSTREKLYEHATHSCVENILERYEPYTYAKKVFVSADPELQVMEKLKEARQWDRETTNMLKFLTTLFVPMDLRSSFLKPQGNWCLKYNKLEVNIDAIQKSQRLGILWE